MTCMDKIAGHVLLVDDDSLVAMNERSFLETAGFVVERAESLRRARSLLGRQSFDVVLLDHDLPDGKGHTLIDWMTARGLTLPVIYLSAAPPAVLRKIGESTSVRAILTKPVDRKQLIEIVRLNVVDVDEPTSTRLVNMEERRMLLDFLQT